MKVPKFFSKSFTLSSALVLISFVFSSCASDTAGGLLSREGSKFNRELSQAIKSADKITIVEHSFWEDFKGSDIDVDVRTAPNYTYRSKTLTAADRTQFAAEIDKLSGAKKKYNHEGCMFAPHYTINFYKNGKKTSSAEVSHRCEDFQWKSDSELTQSKDLFKALNTTIKRAGFNPSTNWKKKASHRYKTDQKKKLELELDLELERKKKQEKEVESKPNIIPLGKPVPGRPGFLFNPYTQNQVDVEGIPSGLKVRDPQDPKGRVFRVP